VTAASGSPPASDFAVTTRSGPRPLLDREDAPVRPSRLDLVGDEDDPVRRREGRERRDEPCPGTTNHPRPGSARSDARDPVVPDLLLHQVDGLGRAPRPALLGASPVGHRYGYDIGIR